MTDLVLDASVAVKWCIPAADEPFAEQAEVLLKRYSLGEVRFLVPDLFWAEIGNTLWKAVRSARLSAEQASDALATVVQLGIPTVSSIELAEKAFEICVQHERSFYDSLYVSLALRSSAQMITADERLANALAARLPVKWLGAL